MSIFPRLHPRLQEAIAHRLGWTHLRPVQEQAGEAMLSGHNAVVLAPTAGGKTEAAIFPALSMLLHDPPQGIGALYIAPIKALLNNQSDRLGQYTEMVGLDRFVWHGDIPSAARRRFIRDPAALLMTTPESLEVMQISPRVDPARLFGDLRLIIIDEIHALAGTDRGAHLASVIERIAAVSRHDIQRIGLSATVGNPDAILEWLRGTSRRPGRVVHPPAPPQNRHLLVVHRDAHALASDAAAMARGRKSLFFCQSRRMTEAIAERMKARGVPVYVHHSSISAEERTRAEAAFQAATHATATHATATHATDAAGACIVCTSTLELGIDVGDLDRVFQAEAPATVSAFLQRMGRTGRRPGQAANTTFFCETHEGIWLATALVELARRGWVESVPRLDRCWPVLVHQLFALCLAHQGVGAEAAWKRLSVVPDFAGIHRAEFNRLIGWMLADGALRLVGGLLIIGERAERRFGRRNFMDFYAVFQSPESYRVLHGERPVGHVDQDFTDRLGPSSCFLLGGRAWAVDGIDHNDRIITVQPAPGGIGPSWSGYLPLFLGFEVCRQILWLLAGKDAPRYLHETAVTALDHSRESFEGILDPPRGGGIARTNDGLSWFTFAGGRINSTLRHALQAIEPAWRVVADNFGVHIRGEGINSVVLDAAIERMADAEFWEDAELWRRIADALPSYRLSKFQSFVPQWVEREMLATHLLDLAGAWSVVAQWQGIARRPVADIAPGRREAPADAAFEPLPPMAPLDDDRPPAVEPTRPLRWVRSDEALRLLCADLRGYRVLGLDVETTLGTRALCLIQIAVADFIALIDVLDVDDLSPLAPLMADDTVPKVVHYAPFETSVMARYGLPLTHVFDTCAESKAQRGKVEGGHNLKAVCARELGLELDKTDQTSDWTRRPLAGHQVAYAAVDAEVMLSLYDVFRGGRLI